MNLVNDIIQEEKERLEKLLRVKEVSFLKIPKGSLRQRKIKNNMFFYRVFREGGKVHSEYLCSVNDIKKSSTYLEEEKRRITLKAEIRELKLEIDKLRKKLG
jgi:hypothetical protein